MQHIAESTLSREREFETRRRLYNYEDLARHQVAVVGLTPTGLPLAITIAQKGYDVIGFDFDADTVSYVHDEVALHFPATDQSEKSVAPVFSSSFNDLRKADTFFLSLSLSQSEDGATDLLPFIEQLRVVAAALRHGSIVLLESSFSPGVSEDIIIPVLEYESDLMVERDFFYVHCPLRADSKSSNNHTPRVIGGAGPLSLERGINVYDAISDAPLIPMGTLKETEAYSL